MKLKKFLPTIVIAGFGVLAFISALIFAGVRFYETNTIDLGVLGSKTVTTDSIISILGLAFGGATLKTTTINDSQTTLTELELGGGMSTFALISVILLALSILITVLAVFVKGKKINFLGAVLMVLAGISMFLILVTGSDFVITRKITDTITNTKTIPFKECLDGFKISTGVYLYSILSILGGLIGIGYSLKGKK